MKLINTCLVLLSSLVISSTTLAKDFSQLYAAADPAVVVIHTDTKQTRSDGNRLKTFTARSLGTGITISDDGLVLTAAHVVNTADKLIVKLQGDIEYTASVLMSIQSADIALIKIDSNRTDFAKVPLGNSDDIKTGEEVFVIGTPYGLDHTLTVGHLSGRRTMETYTKSRLEFLQTDAAVNQGNSGGPMFNINGELIGIVSHIQSMSGGNEGLGFAASINMIRELMLEVPPIWFGMEYVFLAPELAAALNVKQPSGLLVEKVAQNSYAEALGLKGGTIDATVGNRQIVLGGDIILSVGPHEITGNKDGVRKVMDYLSSVKEGDKMRFKILRMGKIMEVSAKKPKPAFAFKN